MLIAGLRAFAALTAAMAAMSLTVTITYGSSTDWNIPTAPKVARHGNVLFVVWSNDELIGAEGDVYGQRLSAATGQRLGNQIRINNSTGGRQNQPMVAALNDGTFVVVWYSTHLGGMPGNIFGQRLSATGAKLGGEFRVDSAPIRLLQGMPTIAALADGGFVVVWVTSDNNRTRYDVRGQIFAANGARLRTPFMIADDRTTEVAPDVAPLPDGGFVVVWEDHLDRPRVTTVIRGQRHNKNGRVVGSRFDLMEGVGDIGLTAVSDGTLVAGWTKYDPVKQKLNVVAQQFSSNGSKIGTELQPNTSPISLNDLPDPGLAPLKNGGFVIVWNQSGKDVCGAQYSADRTMRGAQFCTESTVRGDTVANPTVVQTGNDRFGLAFRLHQRGGEWGITAGILDVDDGP